MQTHTLASFLLAARLCLAQGNLDYVMFGTYDEDDGGVNGISSGVQDTLDQADTNPNASHTVRLSLAGVGDWDWTLQISNVSVPAIDESVSDAHVAYTTWHFSRAGDESTSSKKRQDLREDTPVCAYLYDINFPYNVSSSWDPSDSSCEPALGSSCANAISNVMIADNCDTDNAASVLGLDECAGMLTGGPAQYDTIITSGNPFSADNVTDGAYAFALTSPYEAGNTTAYQVAEETLRLMVLSGPKGAQPFCNRVAREVEIGSSAATALSLPRVGGLAFAALACALATYWL